MNPKIEWPDGKDFAFTIFDDPDLDNVENVGAIYSFLEDLGLRTTKAVWPVRGQGTPRVGGTTCEDERYLKGILSLKDKGVEVALHNVTYHTSTREQTAYGLDRFRQLFGHDPYSMANHTGCKESMYWGSARLSGIQQFIYNFLNLYGTTSRTFQGQIETSPLFWGDLCRERVKYVRNFHFGDINTLKACPAMPYHDPARPYVKYWFAGSEGPNVGSFNAMLREGNQDRLMKEGGACIMYTHLAAGFLENGRIDGRFKVLMERLSKLNGWFVPVHMLLDHILVVRGRQDISDCERNSMERRWLMHKIINTWGRS